MEFMIDRTSEETPPCAGCRQEVDELNHPIFIREFKTIEDLVAFTKEVGRPIIVASSFSHSRLPLIEIYDDYRE
jgi:hypothetical protein